MFLYYEIQHRFCYLQGPPRVALAYRTTGYVLGIVWVVKGAEEPYMTRHEYL